LLLVELRLLPRGAEEKGKPLVGDHQRKEGRKEEVLVLGFVGGFISIFPSHPNGNSHKRRAIVCG
jgi:hypothetical protein